MFLCRVFAFCVQCVYWSQATCKMHSDWKQLSVRTSWVQKLIQTNSDEPVIKQNSQNLCLDSFDR